MCERNVLSGFRAHSNIHTSEVSILPGRTTKSAKNYMVEPPTTGVWVSVQLLYMIYRTIFSSALELSELKTVVGQAC